MTVPLEIVNSVSQSAALCRNEICGLITISLEVYPIKNVSLRPETSFIFDKRQYFDTISRLCNAGETVLCLYHSHPTSTADPSEEDLQFMQRSHYDMLIVSSKGHRYLHAAQP